MKIFLNQHTDQNKLSQKISLKLARAGFNKSEISAIFENANNLTALLKSDDNKNINSTYSKTITSNTGKKVEIIAQNTNQQNIIRRFLSI